MWRSKSDGPLLRRRHFHRILDARIGLELFTPELTVRFDDLTDIDVADDVAGIRIDRDWPARAFESHALHGGHQGIAVGIAARFLERLVDQVHAVIGAERDEIRTEAARFL